MKAVSALASGLFAATAIAAPLTDTQKRDSDNNFEISVTEIVQAQEVVRTYSGGLEVFQEIDVQEVIKIEVTSENKPTCDYYNGNNKLTSNSGTWQPRNHQTVTGVQCHHQGGKMRRSPGSDSNSANVAIEVTVEIEVNQQTQQRSYNCRLGEWCGINLDAVIEVDIEVDVNIECDWKGSNSGSWNGKKHRWGSDMHLDGFTCNKH